MTDRDGRRRRANPSRGSVRRGQLVTTFGPGAVLPLEDESFMVCGIDRWHVSGPNLYEPRLERELHVDGFVVPPAAGEEGVPVVRFPRWHSCPGCRRLAPHDHFTDLTGTTCGDCGLRLIPSRFVVACPRGHIDDFPYSRWVHEGGVSDAVSHLLRLEARGASASLRDIVVSCETCDATRTLAGAFNRFALRDITRCLGGRPWLTGGAEECTEHVRALQRGASNVWFSHLRSALSIPPWSEGAYRLLERDWRSLRAIPDEALEGYIEGRGFARGTDYSTGELADVVRERLGRTGEDGEDPLRLQEFKALCRGREEGEHDQQFVAVEVDIPGPLTQYLAQVMLVKRLREIRVLDGFARVNPIEGKEDERIADLFRDDPGWLPAIEVKGEGVFLRLLREQVALWADKPEVVRRAKVLDDRQKERARRQGWQETREVSSELLLLHTLAHALIEQFSLDAGYPTASLRERLFTDEDACGILIYTASSDSAGSLGGVVAQARTDRLADVFIDAVERVAWCAADPVCVESDGQGIEGLNLAACHACALLPESSCEEYNVLLDRAMLVGTPDDPDLGFFHDLLVD